jgi:hypothetical protein
MSVVIVGAGPNLGAAVGAGRNGDRHRRHHRDEGAGPAAQIPSVASSSPAAIASASRAWSRSFWSA